MYLHKKGWSSSKRQVKYRTGEKIDFLKVCFLFFNTVKENAFLKNQDIWSKQKEIIQIWKVGEGTSSQENQFLEKESISNKEQMHWHLLLHTWDMEGKNNFTRLYFHSFLIRNLCYLIIFLNYFNIYLKTCCLS